MLKSNVRCIGRYSIGANTAPDRAADRPQRGLFAFLRPGKPIAVGQSCRLSGDRDAAAVGRDQLVLRGKNVGEQPLGGGGG